MPTSLRSFLLLSLYLLQDFGWAYQPSGSGGLRLARRRAEQVQAHPAHGLPLTGLHEWRLHQHHPHAPETTPLLHRYTPNLRSLDVLDVFLHCGNETLWPDQGLHRRSKQLASHWRAYWKVAQLTNANTSLFDDTFAHELLYTMHLKADSHGLCLT